MHAFTKHPLALATMVLVATLGMSACGGPTSEKLLASSAAFLEKGEPKAAIIEAKTALQKGDSAQGRFLLGKGLLLSGDAAGAEVELRRALAQGQPEVQVSPLLAEALMGLGRDKEVVDNYAGKVLGDARAQAQLKASLAVAYARQTRLDLSAKAIDDALAADPQYVRAMLLRARLLASRGNADQALAQVDAALVVKPNDHDALLLKGSVLTRVKNDRAAATAAYEAALAAKPFSLAAHTELFMLAMESRDFDGAGKRLAAMKQNKALTSNPQVLYLETRLALARGNLTAAKDVASQLLKAAPEHPLVLEMVGLVAFEAKDLPQALAHLQNAVKGMPELPQARLGLARTHLRMSQPAKALATLQPALSGAKPGSQALALAGEAHLQLSELDKAEALFKRASQANPADPAGRTALALLKFGQGDARAAILELNEVAEADPGTVADLALVTALLRTNQYPAARKAVGRLSRKMPDKPIPPHLRGLAQLGMKQPAEARGSFEQALEVDAAYYPALAQLARLDIDEGKADTAQQRIDKFLQVHPGQSEATRLQAQLRRRAGASGADIATLLANAVKVNPADTILRLNLVQQHEANGRKDLALAAAQDAAAAFPNDSQIVDALGRAQVNAGDRAQGLATFGKLVSMRADNPLGHLRIAEAQLTSKNYDAARTSLGRAVALAPESPDILARRVAVELAAGKSSQALELARAFQTRQPKMSAGFVIEGDVHAAASQWAPAVAAYRQGQQRQPSAEVALRLHAALSRAGKGAEADTAARAWLKEHPKDTPYLFGLGQAALARKEFERAEGHFLAVVEQRPRDAAALNNAAWARLQRGGQGATAWAEKANTIEPNNPRIMETLALTLVAQGRAGDALPLLKRAVVIAPGLHTIRLSLAKTYVQLNQKGDAKLELNTLKQLGDAFGNLAEVDKLLAAL